MKNILIFISVGLFCVIVLAPIVFLFVGAFSNGPETFQNFLQNFLSSRSLSLLVNSLTVGLGTTAVAFILGIPLGILISRTDMYGQRAAGYLYLLPFLVPPYIMGIVWIYLLGNAAYGILGTVWIMGLSYFPFVTLLSIAGLNSIDRRIEEQAELIAHTGHVLRRITLPLIKPYLVAAALFVFIFAVSNYGVPSLLRVNTYPIEIFTQFAAFYNQNMAILTCLPLILMTIVLIIVANGIMKNKSFVTLCGKTHKPKTIPLKKGRGALSGFVWLMIFVSGILPILTLIVKAGAFSSYARAFQTSVRPIFISLGISSFSACLCVVIGFFIAYFIERVQKRYKSLSQALVLIPLAIPPTALGIGLIQLWNRPSLAMIYSHFSIVVFALVAAFVPFAILTLMSTLRQMNTNMEEAASLTEAGFVSSIGKIVLPLCRRGILAAWVICFVFAMGECAATLLVIPAGIEMLSNKIFTLMHYGVGKLTSALCVIYIFVTFIMVFLVGLFFRKDFLHD